MVVGIHCRGKDLAYFPPRRSFPTTFVYIFVVRMQSISVDFTSCVFVRLVTMKLRRVPDFLPLYALILLSNARLTTVR